jgi:hypothetical protein
MSTSSYVIGHIIAMFGRSFVPRGGLQAETTDKLGAHCNPISWLRSMSTSDHWPNRQIVNAACRRIHHGLCNCTVNGILAIVLIKLHYEKEAILY